MYFGSTFPKKGPVGHEILGSLVRSVQKVIVPAIFTMEPLPTLEAPTGVVPLLGLRAHWA